MRRRTLARPLLTRMHQNPLLQISALLCVWCGDARTPARACTALLGSSEPNGHAHRTLARLLIAWHADVNCAVLGGPPEQFSTADTTVVSKVTSTYSVRETTLAVGTKVREYVADNGLVFAVTWSGPFLPELKPLLRKYFAKMGAESAKPPQARRSHVAVNHAAVVINVGGHMRSFEGEAWLPAVLPAGFVTDGGQ